MAPDDEFRIVDPSSAPAVAAVRRYYEELAERFPHGFDVEAALRDAAERYRPPSGVFVVRGPSEACGALRFLDGRRAEIKRMWVAPEHRRRGIAGRLLARLEELAAGAGRSTVVLDTNSALSEALALYERRGYRRVPAYNDNPDADVWLAKELAPA